MSDVAATPFRAIFGRDADATASAPGRVNLIGEHTDYNDGFVLPAAIPQRTTVGLAARQDENVRAWSVNADETQRELAFGLGMERPRASWVDYVQGVTWALRRAGHTFSGFDMHVESSVPLGAGLSSSASLEVAVIRAIDQLFGLCIDPVEVARLAHQAETEFVGVPVGVMDQMASSLATTDAALFIDTRSLHYERVPIPSNVELLIIDSGITHEHAGGEYRLRRQECEDAALRLGLGTLREASAADIGVGRLPPPLDRRVRHVLTENERAMEMRAALVSGNVPAAGALMNASHRSMRDDFEVSTPDIDILVDLAQAAHSVAGARLTGGGFGGCIVGLVGAGRASDTGNKILTEYRERTGRPGRVLVPEPKTAA